MVNTGCVLGSFIPYQYQMFIRSLGKGHLGTQHHQIEIQGVVVLADVVVVVDFMNCIVPLYFWHFFAIICCNII